MRRSNIIFTAAAALFGAVTLFSAEIYQFDPKGETLSFGSKKCYTKERAMAKDNSGTAFYPLRPGQSLYIGKMLPAEAESLEKGNFSFKTRIRMTGKNGHIYLFGIGAGAGDEGLRAGIELRDGTIIPYVTLNFTTAPKKYKVHCIAARKNNLLPGKWFNLALTVNRTGKMTMFLNGMEVASQEIGAMAENKMECFAKQGVAISSAKSKSYMQFRPLVLKEPYDAGVEIASMVFKTGLMSSVELKKDRIKE